MELSPVASPHLAARAGGVAVLLASGSLAVLLLVTPALTRLAAAVRDGSLPGVEDTVTGGCAAALACCWAWCLVTVLLVVVDAARAAYAGRPAPRSGSTSRRVVELLVLTALGLGAGTAPAPGSVLSPGCGPRSAHDVLLPAPSGLPLSGLPLPDRQPATSAVPRGPGPGASGAQLVRVAPGDSLWRIARRRLPAGATDGRVDRAWRLLAVRNRAVVGPDPDLIFPGTVLRVPAPDSLAGKERS